MHRLLALLLMVWEPLSLSLIASGLMNRLTDRGWPAVALLLARLAITGFGVAAGRALWSNRPGAIALARWAVGLALVAVVLTYTTSLWPRTLPPGLHGPVVTALIAWHGGWLIWLLTRGETR